MTDYTIDLKTLAAWAAARQDEFEVLRYTLEFMEDELPDADLDAHVEAIAAPVVDAIDCLECAHCCNTLDVYLTPGDAARLAEGLHLPLTDVITRYIDQESAQVHDEWGKLRHSPCSFLDGNACMTYAHRPESCRAYPAFTPDFRWMLAEILPGAGRCPIIYHVLDGLAQWLETFY